MLPNAVDYLNLIALCLRALSAQSLGLPLVPPFLARSGTATFRRGANFAVGGATALDTSFFHRWDPPGGSVFPLNTSLGVQMRHNQTYVHPVSVCSLIDSR